jgi:DNA repair protein RadC
MKDSNTTLQGTISQENLFLSNVAEVKISYSTHVKASERRSIAGSRDANEILILFWDKNTIEHVESMKIILLNRANKVLGIASLSTGGTSSCIVDVKTVFQYAIKANASSIILAHNHPSGNLKPSDQDLAITQKIKDAAKLLDISLLDHLIITACDGYYSMTDEGVL